jgi:ADP-heptose:LPS heptosyltransferase
MKQIEIFFKNIFLKLLLFISKQTSNRKENDTDYSKILFIRLNRIGDALVSTPLLHLIKEKLKIKIYVLADKKNYFVFTNNPDIDKVITFKKGINGIKEVLNYITKEKLDTIVDLHDDVSTTVSFIIALSKAKNKLGLEKENKIIYTKTIPRLDSKSVHVVKRLLELSRLFDINPDAIKSEIKYYPSSESLKKAEDYFSVTFPNKKFVIGINISAGSDARFWGVERYYKLVNFLLEYYQKEELNILILSAPKDFEYAKEIFVMSKDAKVFNNQKQLAIFSSESFDEFASIISKINLLFTPDTAAVHLAAAFRVPVFGIFVHDTDDMIWSPYGVDFDYVSTSDPNLHNISYETAINKFQPFLENKLAEQKSK